MRILQRLFVLSISLATLPLQAAITGSVMNIDGQALAGAKISIFAPESVGARRARLLSKTPQREALVTTSADANGNFRIDPPKDKPLVDLRAEASGYAPEGMRMASDDDAGAMVLTRAESKTGIVTANGKPVAGATVVLGGGGEYVAVTDANGHYTAPDPSKWATRLAIFHPDFARLEEGLLGGGPNRPAGGGNRNSLDRTLNAGVKVSGKVVGDDGTTGVADAAIDIDGWPAGKSGADGTFTFEHAPKTWQEVRAVSGSRIAARANGGAITLKLGKGGTLTGSVRDIKTQLPVAGAEVMISAGGTAGRFGGGLPFESAQTDAKGNFTISPLAPGRYTVSPGRPNYTVPFAEVSIVAGQAQSKSFFATAVARVSGIVVDEDKRPVAAAHIATQNAGRPDAMMIMAMARLQSGRTTYSGPDGRFVERVTELDSDVQIGAVKKGFPPTKSSIMRLAAGERKSGLTLVIPRGVAFSGRVLDKNGKPVSGVSVEAAEAQADAFGAQIRRMVASATRLRRDDDNVTTAADGTFTVRIKEGKYDVVFKREGYSAKTLRAQTIAANQKPVEVTLDPSVEITGRVVRGGAGVEGVNVTAFSEVNQANTITGPDGSFTLSDLTPGQMMVAITKMDSMIQEIRPMTAPAQNVVVELPAGGRISGRVVDKATHQPITAFQAGISTSRGGGGMVVMTPPMLKQFTSDDGTFTLENVKPGPTQVVASAPGYTTGRAPTVEVQDGKAVADVEVALEAGAKLVGRVTDSNGAPISGVAVRSDVTGGGRVMRFDAADSSAVTDPSGEYAIDSLEPGDKSFVFSRSGYVSETKSITLAGGKDNRLDVTLGSGVRVSGTVITDAGAAVSEATVSASSAAGAGHQAHSDANGAFTIEGLAPGHYTFTATKVGLATGIVRDVDIATNNNVQITMKSGGTITGHITGLAANELEQTTVTASGANGNASTPVDSTGNYRIDGAPTGTVRVAARTGQMFGGSARSAPPKTVQLDAGGTAQVDLEFKSDTVIRGRVLRNNQPVASANINFFPRQGKTQTNASTTSNSNGEYQVSGLEDGPYNVSVVDMQTLTPFSTTYEVQGSGNFDIEFHTADLRGHVLDAATGEPLADARIDLRATGSDAGPFASRSQSTDSNGTFIFPSVTRGSYQITADKQGYGNDVKSIAVTDTPDEVEFKLNSSAGITLKVVDGRDGTNLGANVRVTDMQGRDVAGDTPFRFLGGATAEPIKLALSPGTYRITVQANGYATRTIVASSPSNQTVALTPGGTLLVRSKSGSPRARLVDTNGMPYAWNPFNPTGVFRISEAPGVTTLPNIAAGHYRLDVLDANDQVVRSIEIDVLEGQSATYDV